MTTRELIQTIRDQKTGTDEFNKLLEKCATELEEFLGGPQSNQTEEQLP